MARAAWVTIILREHSWLCAVLKRSGAVQSDSNSQMAYYRFVVHSDSQQAEDLGAG
jgi:hypothetical protein